MARRFNITGCAPNAAANQPRDRVDAEMIVYLQETYGRRSASIGTAAARSLVHAGADAAQRIWFSASSITVVARHVRAHTQTETVDRQATLFCPDFTAQERFPLLCSEPRGAAMRLCRARADSRCGWTLAVREVRNTIRGIALRERSTPLGRGFGFREFGWKDV